MLNFNSSIWIGLCCSVTGLTWAQGCSSSSAQRPLTVVELYTSQGCSSCPPADRWLSSLQARPDVLAMAFHVNYWNHLGWKDPFATAQTTQRQVAVKNVLRGDYVYTPQVIVNGVNEQAWSRRLPNDLPVLKAPGAPTVLVQRKGDVVSVQVSGQVSPSANAVPPRWAGYWVVLQDGQQTQVRAGENAGHQLRNDHVVVHYAPLPAWPSSQAQQFTLGVATTPTQRVAFVVTQDNGIVPVQAAALSCDRVG